jgi:hypothetical protein
VTIRDGIVFILDPQLTATAPAVQFIAATSTGVGPSPAGQLRSGAQLAPDALNWMIGLSRDQRSVHSDSHAGARQKRDVSS